jgi:hypothetical protein
MCMDSTALYYCMLGNVKGDKVYNEKDLDLVFHSNGDWAGDAEN